MNNASSTSTHHLRKVRQLSSESISQRDRLSNSNTTNLTSTSTSTTSTTNINNNNITGLVSAAPPKAYYDFSALSHPFFSQSISQSSQREREHENPPKRAQNLI
ncbi:hypothetical protein E2C01_022178 [Portunus trituberculatus]|uniref:Uncharacterized protein n=1 Tax=Portunus trituberculatus TaxID=210409 RepID=A0A5B7E4P4_PORTR|nr:hypothetical protein [Portunus trituberculatus]